jgi:hypothetical protein
MIPHQANEMEMNIFFSLLLVLSFFNYQSPDKSWTLEFLIVRLHPGQPSPKQVRR